MVRQAEDTSTTDGLEIGDLILAYSKTPMYGRVVKIYRRWAEKNDYYLGRSGIKEGDELGAHIVVERILNMDLTDPKRKSQATLYHNEYTKVDREFILKMFHKINDTLAYSKLLKERGQ